MSKILVSGPILVHLVQIRATKFLFIKNLAPLVTRYRISYHHVLYQEKLMIQSWENLVAD